MKPILSFSAPANVLLMGEYAITLEGGRGIAVAVQPRARATLLAPEGFEIDAIRETLHRRGAAALLIIARMTAGDLESDEPATTLRDAVCDEYGLHPDTTTDRGPDDHEPFRLVIDTSPFFDPRTGAKRGLGSSAAASLLATAAVDAVLRSNSPTEAEELIPRAIAVHRAMHGGRGSGYDVATSALGGFVAFTGGLSPSARSIVPASESDRREIHLYSLTSGKPVHSPTAVRRFEDFVGPEERIRLMQRSNELVDAFQEASRWCDLFAVVESARHLSEEIGAAIGVDASLPFNSSHKDDGWIAKASGAGNERAIVLAKHDARRPLPSGAELLRIDRRGILREEPPR